MQDDENQIHEEEQIASEDEMVNVPVSELTKHCRSKKDFWKVLYHEGDFFMPPLDLLKIGFIN